MTKEIDEAIEENLKRWKREDSEATECLFEKLSDEEYKINPMGLSCPCPRCSPSCFSTDKI